MLNHVVTDQPQVNALFASRCGTAAENAKKIDWKKHKLICKILKKLSDNLHPFVEVLQVIVEIFGAPGDVRVLRHLLAYAHFNMASTFQAKFIVKEEMVKELITTRPRSRF